MRLRFTAAVVSVTLVALAALLVPLSFYLRDVETDRITTALQRDAFILAGRSEESLEQDSPEATLIAEMVREHRSRTGARVVIADADGIAIVTSDDDPGKVGDSYASRPEIAQALTGEIATGVRHSTTLGIDLLYVAVPVLSGEHVLGAVRLTYPAQVVTDAVNTKLAGLGVAALSTIVAAGVVGAIFAAGVTRQLRRLTELTEGFTDGHLDVRADVDSGAPELRSLAHSFNVMAERLGDALDEQRRFAADAAHQLRTPITALRLRLDRARELAQSGDAAGAADRIGAALAEADRLDGLVEGLLSLTRSEGELRRLESLDLVALGADQVARWEPLAAESDVVLRFETDHTVAPVVTSRGALEQILDNLLDNAMGASTEAGAEIVVKVQGGDVPSVWVLDRGPGIPPDQLPDATARLWTTKPDGTGLGLAIASRLARVAGGRLVLANRPAGGFAAGVEFDRRDPGAAESTAGRRRRSRVARSP